MQNGTNINAQGKIIGTREKSDTVIKKVGNLSKKNVFDNNPLTFFELPDSTEVWVGLDFGTPININKIIYYPRGDGNIITYGDEYELKYWDNDQWNSLGRKTADNIQVTFDNCPVDALFLLHDCTRGVDDRIFLYKEGEQEWW